MTCTEHTTHFSGCDCHEAQWNKELAAVRDELFRIRHELTSLEERCEGLLEALEDAKEGLDTVTDDLDHCFCHECVPTKQEVESGLAYLNGARDALAKFQTPPDAGENK